MLDHGWMLHFSTKVARIFKPLRGRMGKSSEAWTRRLQDYDFQRMLLSPCCLLMSSESDFLLRFVRKLECFGWFEEKEMNRNEAKGQTVEICIHIFVAFDSLAVGYNFHVVSFYFEQNGPASALVVVWFRILDTGFPYVRKESFTNNNYW